MTTTQGAISKRRKFVADGVFFSLRLARGQAEREDRNGHCNLLHDRSTPKGTLSRVRARPSDKGVRPARAITGGEKSVQSRNDVKFAH